MLFNSYEFIFLFLPVTVVLYFLANKFNPLLGKLVIIFASVYFYSVDRLNMVLYLGLSIFLNYSSAVVLKRLMNERKNKNRIFVIIPIVVNVGLLLYFKYLNFAITNVNDFFGKNFMLQEIILPIGISFYTFQQIAYIIATERGEIKNNSIVDYLTYILYFPKLIMGPITDPVDFISQINSERKKSINLTNIAIGVKLFSLGLIKKYCWQILLLMRFHGYIQTSIKQRQWIVCFYCCVIHFRFISISVGILIWP